MCLRNSIVYQLTLDVEYKLNLYIMKTILMLSSKHKQILMFMDSIIISGKMHQNNLSKMYLFTYYSKQFEIKIFMFNDNWNYFQINLLFQFMMNSRSYNHNW